jgi:hypothetical protein
MGLQNDSGAKLMQSSILFSLSQYEKLTERSATLANDTFRVNLKTNNFTEIIQFSVCIHAMASAKSIEAVFFKFFIGEMSINRIIREIYVSRV